VPERAKSIGRSEAQAILIQHYIDNAVAVERRMVHKIFHTLKWTPREIEMVMDRLVEQGKIREVHVSGLNYTLLVSLAAVAAQ